MGEQVLRMEQREKPCDLRGFPIQTINSLLINNPSDLLQMTQYVRTSTPKEMSFVKWNQYCNLW